MAPEDRSTELFASTIFGLTIATVTVALRCYVRIFMLKIFSWEDYLAVITTILFGGYGACVFLAIQYGAGKHLQNVPVEDLPDALMMRWLGEWIYVPTSIFVKVTVSILLLRICSKPWHKTVIYVTISVVVVWNTIYAFLAAFQCVPVQHFWQRISDPDGGQCLSEEIITGTTYAAAGINCLADWILGLLPIALVWNLELNRRTKASIAGILALGIIDFLYVFVDFTIWSTIELAMGLAASSIATLRPLFKKVLGAHQVALPGLVIHRRDEISMGTPMPITPTTAAYTTRRDSVSSAIVDVERYAIAPWERSCTNEEWKIRSGGSPVSVRGAL
ncbi:hypothetical protein PG997_004364 [Apiospora hydei]|uniref:Rhodopsin domain-containing protein n=1 Tax=Apiospora hydei TaxID=1337664 RepID=A0ABR1X1X0_9PEZI